MQSKQRQNMPKLYFFFFMLYGLLWKFALLFLRRNKRIKDGYEQRQIPHDWLHQDLISAYGLSVEKNPDKPYFGFYEKKEPSEKPHSEQNTVPFSLENTRQNTSKHREHVIDLWLQAASGGEAYLACELIKTLIQNPEKFPLQVLADPEEKRTNTTSKTTKPYSILITTWTRQGMQVLTQELDKIYASLAFQKSQELQKNYDSKSTQTCQNSDGKQDVYTYSGVKVLPFIQIRFAPLDTYEVATRALELAKPKLCVMLETELWPHFMLVCKEQKIPLYVVNGRMSKSAFELYKIIASVLNYVAPKHVLAITKDDMQRFSTIFPSALVGFMPNIKFDKAAELVAIYSEKTLHALETFATSENHNTDSSFLPVKMQLEQALLLEQNQHSCQEEVKQMSILEQKTYLKAMPMLFSKAGKTFLFASIRQEEENFFASLLWRVYPKRRQDIFIIAPRHLYRVKHWRRRFYDLGMKFVIASEVLKDMDFSADINFSFDQNTCIIWDIFGDLPDLYSQSDVAIVGGSFKKLGGQNFLEAIACGAKTYVGSNLDNFEWALGEDQEQHTQNQNSEYTCSLLDAGLVHRCDSKKILEKELLAENMCKKTAEERFEIQKKLGLWLESRCGGSELALQKLLYHK